MRHTKGLTIVQLMVILLIAGVVARIAVHFVIEKRCETIQASTLCADRTAVSAK